MISLNENDQRRVFFVARLLMSLMFIESFADKLLHWDFYLNETASKHIPLPIAALAAAALVELFGSIAILTGFALPLGALLLAGYCVMLNFFYFDFWNLEDVASTMARKEFLKNVAVAGGLLALAAINLKYDTKPQEN